MTDNKEISDAASSDQVNFAASSSAPLSIYEVPEALGNASTAVEHQKIAEYFARKAADYDTEAALHERILAAYTSGPGAYPATFVDHGRQLRKNLLEAARVARMLEHAHRQLAERAHE